MKSAWQIDQYAHSYLWVRGLSGVLFTLACMLLVSTTVSCQRSGSWLEAVDNTVPPNPEGSVIRATSQGPTSAQSSGSGAEGAPSLRSQEVITSPADRAPGSELGRERSASLEIVLVGDPSCFEGAVRCYIDGRYVGLIGEEGKYTAVVSPGKHLLEVWDSRGRWQIEFTANIGESLSLPVRCEDRQEHGAY